MREFRLKIAHLGLILAINPSNCARNDDILLKMKGTRSTKNN